MSNKFMNLPIEYSSKDSSVLIIPINYEGNMANGSGTINAYKSIISASYELEYFDFELKVEPYQKGLFVFDPISSDSSNHLFAINEINSKLTKLNISKDKFPIIIGGDHSITNSSVNFMENKICIIDEFGVIIFDAHSDLREFIIDDNNSWPHACVTREIIKKHKTLILGVRSQSLEEFEFLNSRSKDSKNINIISSKQIIFKLYNLKAELSKLPRKIFISIDVDVFDPSVIKNTNTPEPGGLNWYTITNILKNIFENKEIIGVDLVEFAPKGNSQDNFSESFILAKLIYKLIAYKYYT